MNELRINAHNVTLLYLWKANMDLEYILDPYACAVYVISYIGKSQRGMSKLLEDALLHLKAGNNSIRERLKGIAYKLSKLFLLRKFLIFSSVSLCLSVVELMFSILKSVLEY